jgi:DNA-binding NarL/FixJ family response regulator
VRIVVGEDSVLFREGLVRLLQGAGHEVVGVAADAPTLVDQVNRHAPDLAIVDVRMPPNLDDDGAKAAAELRKRHPEQAIVLLSQHIETKHSVAMAARGRFGYLLKDRVLDVHDFLDALRRVAAGGTALDSEVVARLLSPRADNAALDSLTPREGDVLALMAEGRTNAGIGNRLRVSERTVETHVANILLKLGIDGSEDGHRRVLAVLAYLEHRV